MTTTYTIKYPYPKKKDPMNMKPGYTNDKEIVSAVKERLEHTQCWEVDKPEVVDSNTLEELIETDGGRKSVPAGEEYDNEGQELKQVEELWVTMGCKFVRHKVEEGVLMLLAVRERIEKAEQMGTWSYT
jgi:hypothetical protein